MQGPNIDPKILQSLLNIGTPKRTSFNFGSSHTGIARGHYIWGFLLRLI